MVAGRPKGAAYSRYWKLLVSLLSQLKFLLGGKPRSIVDHRNLAHIHVFSSFMSVYGMLNGFARLEFNRNVVGKNPSKWGVELVKFPGAF